MTTTTATLTEALLADGYRPGPPRQLHAEHLQADIAIYSTLECEQCGHDRHAVQPFHRGRAYVLVCSCRACGHQTEA